MMCAADIIERAAIIEADGADREDAEAQALAERGLASWDAFASEQRRRIVEDLATLPRILPPTAHRLALRTRQFVATPWFREALREGWTAFELFGVHPIAPIVRIEAWGLLPSLVLSRLSGPKLEHLDASHAVIRYASDGCLRWRRGNPGIESAERWWTSDVLIGIARVAA